MQRKSSINGLWLVESTWWVVGQRKRYAQLANYDQVRNEIAVLKKVSMGHRNILTLVDYFETMNNRESIARPSRC